SLAADWVRVWAAGREARGGGGAAVCGLPPLGVPGRGGPAGVAGSDAVALFGDRARRADPHFTLNAGSGLVAGRIVARLDGMPLAIELAAARVEALGLGQLLDRLRGRFRLLAGGGPPAGARARARGGA